MHKHLSSDDAPYVVFSVLPEKQDEFRQHAPLYGAAIREVEGCYKGEQEPAWIIPESLFPTVLVEGWLEGQESALHLGPRDREGGRIASLWHLTVGGHKALDNFIGTFKAVPDAVAAEHESWTKDRGQYYAVV